MDERKQRILQAIVIDYIQTAEPVGSRTISRKYNLGLSPATIRNEMADLEDLGFLEQPHTSAGRIPSDKGYRFYVDRLMNVVDIPAEVVEHIYRALASKAREVDVVIQQTAKLLSHVTNYTSLVLGPTLHQGALRHLQILPMDERCGLVIIVSDSGVVENKLIPLPEGITAEELAHFSRAITKKLAGVSFAEIRSSRLRELETDLYAYRDLLQNALDILWEKSQSHKEERVFLGGTSNLFSLPEFKDQERIRAFLSLLEAEDTLSELLSEGLRQGITIRIGQENRFAEVKDYSVVTADYAVNGQVLGTLGVIGPTRMEYDKVVSVLSVVTELMGDVLSRLMKV